MQKFTDIPLKPLKHRLKTHKALPENKAELIYDSFFHVSYNFSKFFGTENALGAPVKVSQSQSNSAFVQICLDNMGIKNRHFTQ